MEKANLEVADIFRNFRHLLGNLPPEKNKVVNDIINCRTSVLGGRVLECDQCHKQTSIYNSCRNRCCPKCQYLARMKWIEKRMEDLLPCPYFHVVLTVTDKLRYLFLLNQEICYNLLFKASSGTLKEVAGGERKTKKLHSDIGFIGVLHTWAQDLINHPHVHFIVPGGKLSKKKNKWTTCNKKYLLPVEVLSKVFKGKMIYYLRKAYNRNELKLTGDIEYLNSPHNFEHFLSDIDAKDWVVYIKKTFAGPRQVINYLGGYTHRIAISNYRLVKLEGEQIFFKCRDKKKRWKTRVISLHVKEFMRRFLLHVPPKKFVRIRHFGLLSNRIRKAKIELIRRLNNIVNTVRETLDGNWEDTLKRLTNFDVKKCPNCRNGRLAMIGEIRGLLNTS